MAFSSIAYEANESLRNLAEQTLNCEPVVIVEWNYPALPSAGELIDMDLLSSFPEAPPALIMPLEYEVQHVYWTLHEKQPIPIIQLLGK